MNTIPPEPSAKDPISATFMKALMRYIRANTLLDGTGYRTSRGPNGTKLVINPGKAKLQVPVLPWTFSCTEDEDSGEREGGWKNCRLQIGYNYYLHSPDVGDKEGDDIFVKTIEDCDQTDDGEYWVEIDVLANEAKIIIRDDNADWSVDNPHDPSRNIVRIRIGEVEDGKQKYGFHRNPIVYKYV